MIPCLYDRPISNDPAPNDVTHYVFNTNAYNIFGVGDARFPYAVMIDGALRLNPVVASAIHAAVPSDGTVVISTMLGGNTHNGLTLLECPEGLDLILPDEPDLPVIGDGQLVPYALARSVLAEQCAIFLNDLRGIRSATTGRVFHVMSPPPIKDDAFLATVVERDPYFASAGRTKVTPASVRYKMWRLHSDIYADTCAELDVEVLAPPAEVTVGGKWLAPDCIGPDPTHGNSVYGSVILKQLEDTLEARYAGWRWVG